jgi:hypothetical protein
MLAKQLPELVVLPPIQNLYDSLFPLVMTLLQDPVACVRKESYRGIVMMIAILHEQSSQVVNNDINNNISKHLKLISAAINSLIMGETYQMRQLWIDLCHRFLGSLKWEIIEQHFIQGILNLANDPVLNVRLSIAALLTGWEGDLQMSLNSNWKLLLERNDIRQCIEKLASDERDIYFIMLKLHSLFPDKSFKPVCKPAKNNQTTSSTVTDTVSSSPKLAFVDDVQKKEQSFVASLPSLNIDSLPQEILSYETSSPRQLTQLQSFGEEPQRPILLDS